VLTSEKPADENSLAQPTKVFPVTEHPTGASAKTAVSLPGNSVAVLRFKILLAANVAALAPGPLMVTMGLSSLIFASFMLYRRRDIKRFFAYSSIEHMGIATFAFGMGGQLANFAGLLHMAMHSLTKSAIFYSVGHVAQVKGTQRMSGITGWLMSSFSVTTVWCRVCAACMLKMKSLPCGPTS